MDDINYKFSFSPFSLKPFTVTFPFEKQKSILMHEDLTIYK